MTVERETETFSSMGAFQQKQTSKTSSGFKQAEDQTETDGDLGTQTCPGRLYQMK